MDTFSTIATVVAGIFIIYLGYLIGVKKMLSLIIGYSDSTFDGDKDRYAKRTGLFTIILGIIVLVMPLAILILGEDAIQIYVYIIKVYVVILVVVTNYWRS
ncbi:DUF3784 domain-containing protein [Virgibacillus sp. 7505]|uniref:DUF3784 domain-containing protein n=1 Tax=Virgibacillus sp. 7505 TaxID=2022548 RepID=UPI000BA6EC1E|nr:DUF3784 domain-containing protein [Virgibacillus sp. 7505]PAE14722.1 DUF3784 domain-containing protein [Virgibacillus sp. 7505]